MILHATLITDRAGNWTTNRTHAQLWGSFSSIMLSGADSTPTLEMAHDNVAIANFTNLTILAGMQGTYRFQVTVRGSNRVLATSLPFNLIRYARTLLLLDQVPRNPNSDTTLMLRVKALSSLGLPVEGAFVTVDIESRLEDDVASAGRTIKDDRNVTGELAPEFARAVTGRDGIATFGIVFRRFVYPGFYVLRFKHDNAPDVFSPAFELRSPIKEIEILSNPAPDEFYTPEPVWPELKARTFQVFPGLTMRKISVTTSPANMKGTIVGEFVDDMGPVIRLKDHRGFAVIGHSFNVTLVDHEDRIVDEVASASRGELLYVDWGLEKDVGICVANDSRYDCDGLYSFENLATNNGLKTGFYRFRFESQGLSVVQGKDLLFMNDYMPNILRLNTYMYMSMGTCGALLILFQFNRVDKLVFQRFTSKYVQVPEERFMYGVLGTGALAVFGWISRLFYVTLAQSKTPPHVLDGQLIPTDLMSTYSIYTLYIMALASCLYAFWFMSRRVERFRSVVPERFLQKLGMNARVADMRRSFVGKSRKHIERPPKISAARGRFAKKLEKYKARIRELQKYTKVIFNLASILYLWCKKTYVRVKYANPAFKSLYFAWPDVFYGIRFRAAFLLNCLLVVTSCLAGLWFGDRFSALLTKYYGTYISLVLAKGSMSKNVDWFDEIWTNKMSLGTLQQVAVIFHARTSKLGQPFFWQFLSAFRVASAFATITSTVIIFARIIIMALEQRSTICNLRMGKVKKEIGDLKVREGRGQICAVLTVFQARSTNMFSFGCSSTFVQSLTVNIRAIPRCPHMSRL